MQPFHCYRSMAGTGLGHLHAEVAHAGRGEQLGAVLDEGHVGDGLVVQLGELQRVDGHENRLLLLLPAAAPYSSACCQWFVPVECSS